MELEVIEVMVFAAIEVLGFLDALVLEVLGVTTFVIII